MQDALLGRRGGIPASVISAAATAAAGSTAGHGGTVDACHLRSGVRVNAGSGKYVRSRDDARLNRLHGDLISPLALLLCGVVVPLLQCLLPLPVGQLLIIRQLPICQLHIDCGCTVILTGQLGLLHGHLLLLHRQTVVILLQLPKLCQLLLRDL